MLLELEDLKKQREFSPKTELAMLRTGVTKEQLLPPNYEELFMKYRDRQIAEEFLKQEEERAKNIIEQVNKECENITQHGVLLEEYEYLNKPSQLQDLVNLTSSQKLMKQNEQLAVRQAQNAIRRAKVLEQFNSIKGQHSSETLENLQYAEARRIKLQRQKEQQLRERSQQLRERQESIEQKLGDRDQQFERTREKSLRQFEEQVERREKQDTESARMQKKQSNEAFYKQQEELRERERNQKMLQQQLMEEEWKQLEEKHRHELREQRQQQQQRQKRVKELEEMQKQQRDKLEKLALAREQQELQAEKEISKREEEAELLRSQIEKERIEYIKEKSEILEERISEAEQRKDEYDNSIVEQYKESALQRTERSFESLENSRLTESKELAKIKALNDAKIELTQQEAVIISNREKFQKELKNRKLLLKQREIQEYEEQRDELCKKSAEMSYKLQAVPVNDELRLSQLELSKLGASDTKKQHRPRVSYSSQPAVEVIKIEPAVNRKAMGSYEDKIALQRKIQSIREQQIEELDALVAQQQKMESQLRNEVEQCKSSDEKVELLEKHKAERAQMAKQMQEVRDEQNKELRYNLYLLEHRFAGVVK